jgi:hypothetical protein
MKSLSSMGGAAKRNLSQLAERFSQSSRASNRTRNGETGTAREFKPLVDNTGDVSHLSCFFSVAYPVLLFFLSFFPAFPPYSLGG